MTRLRADLLLVLTAAIWGSAFVVQRVAAVQVNVFAFNGLRFFLASLILIPFTFRRHTLTVGGVLHKRSIGFIGLAGLLLFAAGGLQQAGLASTTAGNAGFITTLYVVIVPLVLRLVWKEHIAWVSWAAAGLAVIGSLLLSTGGAFHLNIGDTMELAGAFLWALHVILVGRAVQWMEVLVFSAGQYLVAGVINLGAALISPDSWQGMSQVWWAVGYTAVFSIALGYTLQVLGQKYAPAHDAAILLSTEAVFAAFFGFLFLSERLLPVQIVGCGMILSAIFITQTRLK